MADGKVKRIKRDDRPAEPIHDDLFRLVNSMKTVLRRRYPDKFERQIMAVKIMRELNA